MRFLLLVLSFALFASAQIPTYEPRLGKSGLDLGAMDTQVSPCTNFYQYACGNWRAKNPIPADQPSWGRFDELDQRNLMTLRGILESAAQPSASRTPVEQKIGDFYAACMDEAGIETKALEPLKPKLDAVNAMTGKAQLAAEVARLHTAGVGGLFRFGAQPDPKNASVNIADFDQGGIALPDRDYYLKTDKESVDLRVKYAAHVAKMFDLLAKSLNVTWDSKAKAQTVMNIETALARESMDRVARRNPDNTYNPTTRPELPKLTPDFEWDAFLKGVGAPEFTRANVDSPGFFKGLAPTIEKTGLDDWKTYLVWNIVHGSANSLPKAYVDETFDFFGKTLEGAQELQPRWKRCVRATDRYLGEALGQKYVDVAFSGPAKAKALELVGAIEKSMELDVAAASWMSDKTKQEAVAKLKLVANKIGYPDKWRDYASVTIERGDYLGDRERAAMFEFHRDLNKIGKAVDKTEWGMTPPTVNAYYNPPENNINFPAGILQPPFYNARADDAVNLGAIGVVVGHELTHGFDDEGRRYDGKGNLQDWWTAADAKQFDERAECVVNEYGAFSPLDGVKLNGKLTLGENAADNGGMRLAYMALLREIADKAMTQEDGFSPEQRFFLGFAQVWCENNSDAYARLGATVDPHSPGQFRTNGVVQNIPEFGKAFACKEHDPMVSSKACRVW